MPADPKTVLTGYLDRGRDVLIWKLEGLSERDQRLPRTPTGTNLLGLVKHVLVTEVGYFGPTFGRAWPTPEELPSPDDADPHADCYATSHETPAQIVELYGRVRAFADETIAGLPLDAVGHVAHWGGAEVTLQQILVHMIAEVQRHAGHADILRELIDGSAGLRADISNLPDDVDWPAHVARLTAIADAV